MREFLADLLRVTRIKSTSVDPNLTLEAQGYIELVSESYIKLNGSLVDVSNKRIINLEDPIDPQDAATRYYVDSQTAALPKWTKYVVTFEDFSSFTDYEGSIILFSLPAKQVIQGVIIKNLISYTGLSIDQYTLSVGVVGDIEKYTSAFDVLEGVDSQYFQASNTLSPQDFENPQDILVTATSSGGFLNTGSAGSAEIYILTSTLPS